MTYRINFVKPLAGAGLTAVIWQEIGKHEISPTSAIVQRSPGKSGFDVRARALHECRVADEDQPIGAPRLGSYRFAPDIDLGDLDAVQRPTRNRNRAGPHRDRQGRYLARTDRS